MLLRRNVIKLFLIIILISQGCKTNNLVEEVHNIDKVNMFIGSSGEHVSEYGGTIPSVAVPFGMTQWTAMTRVNHISKMPYHFKDTAIIGFLGTHQPAIWMGDYGFVSVMPQSGKLEVSLEKRGYRFNHEEEKATPYSYSVRMYNHEDQPLDAKILASSRCARLVYNYPGNEDSYMVIDGSRLKDSEGWIQINPGKREIVGYNPDRYSYHYHPIGPELPNFKGYFIIQFDQEFQAYGTYNDTLIYEGKNEEKGDKIGGFIKFSLDEKKEVNLLLATSFISLDQARQNLELEKNNMEENNKKEWEEYLDRIIVEGGTMDQQTIFYTALYRCFQYPRIFSEYGRYYSAFDDTIHEGVSYNDYSLWDTYRALHPLLTLIAPEHVSPMVQSLVQMYEEGGWIPKWPNPSYTNIMIGTHADGVIADACIKGFDGFDKTTAYEAIYKNAMTPPDGDSTKKWLDRDYWSAYEARGGLTWFKQLGYVPADKTYESVSRTIEFSYGDYCLAQMAKYLGKNEDFEFFMKRSNHYKNLFNENNGFFWPRLYDGDFVKDDYGKYRPFTEGSPWTYLFGPVHDIEGLMDVLGGKQEFIKKLDENFDSLHYRHDNEPGHHYIYLYNYVGQPWKTQEKLWEHAANNYKNSPGGLSGNDDCGQMSAWLVFTSMGFYPVTPASNVYALGVPMFDKITIQYKDPLPNKKFTIIARGLSSKNKYVKSVKINETVLEQPFITHDQLMKGDSLIFEMDSVPVHDKK